MSPAYVLQEQVVAPSMMLIFVKKYTRLLTRLGDFNVYLLNSLLFRTEPLVDYYRINDLLWQDGLLIDFVQKKITDKWVRKFLVSSSYLFSERVLFTFVVKFYNDLVIWSSTVSTIFEFSNISLMLHFTLTALLALLVSLNLGYLFVIFF